MTKFQIHSGSSLYTEDPAFDYHPQEVIVLDAKLYEVLSLAMRYFFTFIGLLIVWRSFRWLGKDRRQKHHRLKNLPDAGTIGILTVEAGDGELAPGDTLPVPHEGVLGYLRTCDVVVPMADVARVHLDFAFVNGKGLFIHPRRGCAVTVDGCPIESSQDSREHPMIHGSVLTVGEAVLRLGVFAGLDVPAVPTVAPWPDAPAEDWSPETPAPFPMPGGYPTQMSPPPYLPYPPQNTLDSAWQGGNSDAT